MRVLSVELEYFVESGYYSLITFDRTPKCDKQAIQELEEFSSIKYY